MSHHSESEFAELRNIRNALLGEQKLGATGRFPRGKIADHDEGEIAIGIAADPESKTVIIDFGKSIRSIGFTSEQAIDLAETINKKAWELRGISPPLPLSTIQSGEGGGDATE